MSPYLPFVCFGKEWAWLHQKPSLWGSYRGNMYVPGKNVFISFHMDAAWWAPLNAPGSEDLWNCTVYFIV